MQRRNFLAKSLAISGVLRTQALRAQTGVTRGAVVIGIDKVDGAKSLGGARSGARSMAQWLHGEGFDVKLLIDDAGTVKASDVFDAVNAYVLRNTLDQLVIYFGGHGFLKGTGEEFALLPNALNNPSEAINLTDSQRFAWYAGIKNVVFISDACRSRADNLQVEAISGSPIFPHKFDGGDVQVDSFLATAIGSPAYEAKLRSSDVDPTGIFTDVFLEAYQRPFASSVTTIDGKTVVTNRLLPEYLKQRVPLRARLANPPHDQYPSARVCSSDLTYIGKVSGDERISDIARSPTVSDVGTAAVSSVLGNASTYSAMALSTVAEASGFAQARSTLEGARGLAIQAPMRTGIAVTGQRVDSVATGPRINAVIVHNSPSGERPSALVAVDVRTARGASVALRLGDGTGTVVAALDTFIANVVVDQGRVVSVSYQPSKENWLRGEYEQREKTLSQMQVAVATTAQFGVFRIEGSEAERTGKAKRFADYIRLGKGLDPTLGLYAAYAYADANLVKQIQLVRMYMRDNLQGVDLFDVAMLSGDLAGKPPGALRAFPFCPMLSQGWGYLRVKDTRLPEGLGDLRDHLRHSLWLTLDGEGVRIVENALRSGRVA